MFRQDSNINSSKLQEESKLHEASRSMLNYQCNGLMYVGMIMNISKLQFNTVQQCSYTHVYLHRYPTLGTNIYNECNNDVILTYHF